MMGVYIKGMEMPKCCMLCPFCVEEADPANGEMCMVTGKLMPPFTRVRLEDCPLVEIPPHGRLGDLDALEKCGKDCYGCPYDSCMITEIVKDSPSVIPADPAEEGEA